MTMLSLLLTLTAFAKKPEPAPVEPVAPPAPAGMTDSDRASAFTGWATALASGNRDAAATALIALIDDPSKETVHGEAWAHLGELYAQMDLKLAAIGAIGKGLSLDPTHTAGSVVTALPLIEETGESGAVGQALGRNVGILASGATGSGSQPGLDAGARNRLSVVAARQQLDDKSYGPAAAILMMGTKDAAGFEDVELMRGVVLAQQDRHGDALVPLLTAQALGIQADRDDKWRNTTQLNVARAYYSSGNYGQAIASYSAIDRSSDFWLDAQFERAWAHFRGNDVNGALAMLFTHESVFFTDFFYPEADLLRAYSLFVMCKFPDASKEMDSFLEKYAPIEKELASVSMSPREAFEDVKALRDEAPTKLPIYVLRPFRHEQRLTDALASVEASEDELKKAEKTGGRLGAIATTLIEEQRDARIETEGKRVLARVEKAKGDLAAMLEGIEITRLDLLNLETQMYERAAATGVMDYGTHIEKLRDMKKKKQGFRVWPWQGEYWADELGWYVFDARPDCPESMARGEGQAAP